MYLVGFREISFQVVCEVMTTVEEAVQLHRATNADLAGYQIRMHPAKAGIFVASWQSAALQLLQLLPDLQKWMISSGTED